VVGGCCLAYETPLNMPVMYRKIEGRVAKIGRWMAQIGRWVAKIGKWVAKVRDGWLR
jgi:hypothetical protein